MDWVALVVTPACPDDPLSLREVTPVAYVGRQLLRPVLSSGSLARMSLMSCWQMGKALVAFMRLGHVIATMGARASQAIRCPAGWRAATRRAAGRRAAGRGTAGWMDGWMHRNSVRQSVVCCS